MRPSPGQEMTYKRSLQGIDLQRALPRLLVAAVVCFCLGRYLVSDDPPDRAFPVSFRPEVCDNCFPYDFRRLIEPRRVTCDPRAKVELVVLITTVPSSRAARDAIRDTWGNQSHSWSKDTRFVFLFGDGYSSGEQTALKREAELYGDILQENYLDNYYNLSLKVIMGYQWVSKSCPQAAFIARSADDNFINIPALLGSLEKGRSALQNVMFGDCIEHAMPWRWPYHKWAISVKEYSKLLFPPYCIGTTFLTSLSMMETLVQISPHVPFFPIEDVYFGMCVKRLGEKYQTLMVEGFNLLPVDDDTPQEKCPYPTPMYTIHPLTPRDIRRTWSLCKPIT